MFKKVVNTDDNGTRSRINFFIIDNLIYFKHRQFANDAEFFAKMQDIVREEIRSQQARERLKTEIVINNKV